MKIKFSPIRTDERLCASVSGDTITLNEDVLDFAPLQEGAQLPVGAVKSPWIVGDVVRENGEICICLLSPHSQSAPRESLFPPEDYLTVSSGNVPFPPYEVTHD